MQRSKSSTSLETVEDFDLELTLAQLRRAQKPRSKQNTAQEPMANVNQNRPRTIGDYSTPVVRGNRGPIVIPRPQGNNSEIKPSTLPLPQFAKMGT